MIQVTRLNGEIFFVNSDMIEFIESTPDTVIALTSGRRVVVQEAPEQLLERTVIFRRKIYTKLPELLMDEGEENE